MADPLNTGNHSPSDRNAISELRSASLAGQSLRAGSAPDLSQVEMTVDGKAIVENERSKIRQPEELVERVNPEQGSQSPSSATTSISAHYPLKRHFEKRPEPIFGSVLEVRDASTAVRTRPADDLEIFRIPDLFASNNEVFLGFGLPNVYLAIPKEDQTGKSKYDKFAAKSFKRAPCEIQDTKNWVQAGAQLHFKNLPDDALAALREAAKTHEGKRYLTCVNANARVLEDAGFTAGEKPLSSVLRPMTLFNQIRLNGLQWRGQDIDVEVIRTTPNPIENYSFRIWRAEFATFRRHALRRIRKFGKETKIPGMKWLGNLGRSRTNWKARETAPPLEPKGDLKEDLNVRVSLPSHRGFWMRQLWGPHNLYEVRQSRVDVNSYLKDTLRAFPQEKPSFVTRLKQRLLFSKPVIRAIRNELCPTFEELGERNEQEVHEMLLTDRPGDNNKFNIVITPDAVTLSRLRVRVPMVDWVLSKHVLTSGYHPDVRFAGEIWKDTDGIVHLTDDSGTYRPDSEMLRKAAKYLGEVFPNVTFKPEFREKR